MLVVRVMHVRVSMCQRLMTVFMLVALDQMQQTPAAISSARARTIPVAGREMRHGDAAPRNARWKERCGANRAAQGQHEQHQAQP